MSETNLEMALDDFIRRYREYADAHEGLVTDYDPQWTSPCLQGEPDANGRVCWQPVRQSPPLGFSDCEAALELSFHPDIKTFYGRYWSQGLNAVTDRGPLQLLQLWNEDDGTHLQQNLIGHVLMKRRLRQPETLFIAVTDDDDMMISIDNQSGAVMLEPVGIEPREQLAPSLAEFLYQLQPGPAF
ncbi:Protein Syd [Saliniradius amylolyticus]|uniref:Protein Syd n=1 Tax=Saliniradius amylolyticus TaxID=2183582 RepID=A0A2S2E4P3_9ALTE|nr:SecY-interacting protein [Saliniradius amylolyticus]AWL12626.1 Protein Syd [Saliniradius amylolyticus]